MQPFLILLMANSTTSLIPWATFGTASFTPKKLVKYYYESIYWYTYSVTQLPFELTLRMPPTDRGKRGYSNGYIEEQQKTLYS